MKVRVANIRDAESLLNYLTEFTSEGCITVPILTKLPTIEQEKKWIEARTDNKGILIIAEDDKKVVGLIETVIPKTKEFEHNCEFGMSVLATYRKKGIGKKLLSEFLKWAKTSDLLRVELNVFSINESAIKLYEKYGFSEDGRRVNAVKLKTGKYCDLVHMYKFIKNNS